MKRFLIVFYLISLLACSGNKENSEDKKLVIEKFSSPAGDSCAQPYLFTGQNGKVYLSWIERKGKESSLKFSILDGENWSTPVTIATGNNWFVNWADYPIMTDNGKGHLLAHYLEKSDTGKFTYDIKLVISRDGGKTWSAPFILHDDQKKAEHGFVSMMPYRDGFFVVWLDGRKAANAEESGHDGGHHGEMTLRAAVLDTNAIKTSEWELDGRVCDCCQTHVALTSTGPVVIYRDRSPNETRDISVIRMVNENWSSPETLHPDNWQIKGCPVNGPRMSAMGNNLAIAWFSMNDDTAQVKVIFSKNGGETFGIPFRIDEGKAIGRVGILMLNESSALVTWMEGGDIKAVKVNDNGAKDESIILASSSEKRSSGFPQLTRTGRHIYFGWTNDKQKTINLARISL